MTVITKELCPSVRSCFIKAESFKIFRISVNMAVPLSRDTAAHYAVLSAMLSRLCHKYPDLTSMNRKLSELYGAALTTDVLKHGDAQIIRLGITALDDRFALEGEEISTMCAELLCEILTNPLLSDYCFREEDVEREKRIILEILDADDSEKRIYAQKKCIEYMCGDDVYGIDRLGTREQISALTAESVFEAWKTLLSKSVVQVNIIGNCDGEKISNLFAQAFTDFGRQTAFELTTKMHLCSGEVREFTERQKVNQSKLVLGYSMGLEKEGENTSAYRVMCDLFGGSPHSKLFTNVREKLSLCYYCSSALRKEKGIMIVQSGILAEKKDTALAEIANQLKKIQDGEFTEDEMSASIKGLVDSFNSVYDSPETLDSWCTSQIKRKEIVTPEHTIAKIKAVTAEQVQQAAQKVRLDTVYFLQGEEAKADAGNS
ncbi:MAG: insulinase family protein [Clostridia bacterium]|nr:insulinase family protein [Clostridia bacterium]